MTLGNSLPAPEPPPWEGALHPPEVLALVLCFVPQGQALCCYLYGTLLPVDSVAHAPITRPSPAMVTIGVCGLRKKLPVAQSSSAAGKESALILL